MISDEDTRMEKRLHLCLGSVLVTDRFCVSSMTRHEMALVDSDLGDVHGRRNCMRRCSRENKIRRSEPSWHGSDVVEWVSHVCVNRIDRCFE